MIRSCRRTGTTWLIPEIKPLHQHSPSADPAASGTCSSSPALVLEIDQHRNHLAILETYGFLRDLHFSPSLTLCRESRQLLRKCLLRLQFFLMHSDSPILSDSDRHSLARVQYHDLASALDQAQHRRHEIQSNCLKHLSP